MKPKIIYFALCLLLASCQKEISDPSTPGPGPGPGPTPPPIADTLLKKIVMYNPGFPPDSSQFKYDSNKRLIREEFGGNIFGVDQKVVTDIARNGAGIITGYTRVSTNTIGQVILTETATVKYDAATSRYVNKVVNFTPASFLSAGDSILYTYNGNTPAMLFQFSKVTAADPYDSVYRVIWTGLYNTRESRYTNFNGWHSHKEFSFGPMEKKNPLYAPEVGLVVGFTLNIVEDDNFNWNFTSMITGNLNQTVTYSGMYAHFTYTYMGNYPLTRDYSDLGSTVNILKFSY